MKIKSRGKEAIVHIMRSEFKHVRNLVSNAITIVLLWILQYIWTLPGFVVVLSYFYSNETCRKVRNGYIDLSDIDRRYSNVVVWKEN